MTPDLEKFYNELSMTGAQAEIRAMIDRHAKNAQDRALAGDFEGLAKLALSQALDVLELTAKFARSTDLARRFLIACNDAALTGITFSTDAPIEYFERVPGRIKDRVDRLYSEIESLQAFKRGVDEACNSGDGSYRP